MAFTLLSGEVDQYVKYLPDIQGIEHSCRDCLHRLVAHIPIELLFPFWMVVPILSLLCIVFIFVPSCQE